MFSSETDLNAFNVEFTKIEFHRRVTLNTTTPVQLLIAIHTSGGFEVIEGKTAVATGMVKHWTHDVSTSPNYAVDAGDDDDHCIVLNKPEIYKELQLRGYRFTDGYQGLESFCWNNKAAKIKWNGSWETFIDAMTHVYLMSRETRAWHLATGIGRIKIDAVKHSNWLASLADKNDDDAACDAFYCQNADTIVAGGIEMSGLKMKTLDRRTQNGTELLEVYQFVPLIDDCSTYSVADAVRICVQLHVETFLATQLTVVEYLNLNAESLIEHFRDVLKITPRVNGTFKLVTDRGYQMESIEIVPTTTLKEKDRSKYSIVVWNTVNGDEICHALENVRPQGYLVMVRYKHDVHSNVEPPKGFSLISVVHCNDFSVVTFQHETMTPKHHKIISIDSNDHQFSWLKEVQRAHTSDNVLLLSERDPTSGVLGFMRSTRYEPNVPNFRCVVIEDDNSPPFDIQHPFYSSQLRLNLPVNIVRSGKWGTFRQLALSVSSQDNIEAKQSKSLCVEAAVRGSIESLVWVPRPDTDALSEHILVKCVGLDNRDVMIASAELSQNVFLSDSVNQDGCFGREYSGIDMNGRNVMGTKINGGALASRIESVSNDFVFTVPDSISLEEAASMPIAYLTAYAAFFSGTNILSGQTILIHNGNATRKLVTTSS